MGSELERLRTSRSRLGCPDCRCIRTMTGAGKSSGSAESRAQTASTPPADAAMTNTREPEVWALGASSGVGAAVPRHQHFTNHPSVSLRAARLGLIVLGAPVHAAPTQAAGDPPRQVAPLLERAKCAPERRFELLRLRTEQTLGAVGVADA